MQESIRFASAGDDIKIWDFSSMTVVEQFNPHNSTSGISSLCWSINNQFLVSAAGSGDKIVVSSCKSKPIPLLELAEGKKQTCLHLNSNSQCLVSGGIDNTVNIWELKSKRLYRSLKDHKDEVTCVRFNANDGYIASGSMSGEIILHNVTTNLSSAPFGHGSTQPIQHLKYSMLKKSLLGSVSNSGTVTLWDVNSQNSYQTFDSAHKAPASEICFSPVNDLLLVTIGLDKRINFYDTSSKILLKTVFAESPLTAVDFMPDGATLTIGSSRGKIYQYDLRMLTSPVKTVAAHKTSVQSIQFQHSSSYAKSNSKGVSSKSSSLNKRTSLKGNSISGGSQNANMVKDLMSSTTTGVLTQFLPSTQSKGTDVNPDKAVTGMPRSTSQLDVIPSKETDYAKCMDLKQVDSFGRSSFGDIFSPVRDDYATQKANEDIIAKGDGLENLPQFNPVFPIRRNPVGASTQGTHASPVHVFSGSPIKEEDENQDSDSMSKSNHLKSESIDNLKQLTKLSSNSDNGNVKTPLSSSASLTPDVNERTGKQVPTQLMYDSPTNGISLASPKLTASATAGVAHSLSEKIADTVGCDGSGTPLTSIQIHFIKNMIEDTLEDFRDTFHRDIVNLQVEMIKQFHMQLNDMHTLLERYSVNDGLVSEIEKLREENKRLRTNF